MYVYREANEEYSKYVREVADELFRSFSIGLGLKESAFRDAVGGEDVQYMMKINYYPPCPRPDLALGVPAHTDLSSLTILVPNEVPGLQVFQEDRWIDVQYIPNALVIHIGDQLQVIYDQLIIISSWYHLCIHIKNERINKNVRHIYIYIYA